MAQENEQFQYEEAGQKRRETLRFAEFFEIIQLRKRYLYFFVALMLSGALLRQVFYVPTFVGVAVVQVAAPSQGMGGGNSLEEGGPGVEDQIRKFHKYLNSRDFYLRLAEHIKFSDEYNRLKLKSAAGLSVFKKAFWKAFYETKNRKKVNFIEPKSEIAVELIPVEQLGMMLTQLITFNQNYAESSLVFQSTTLDPFTSMFIANSAAKVFIKVANEFDQKEVAQIKNYVGAQLAETTEKLKKSEMALIEFKRKRNIVSIDVKHREFSNRAEAVQKRIQAQNLELEQNKKLIQYYEKKLMKADNQTLTDDFAEQEARALVKRLRLQIKTLKKQKALATKQGYEDSNWRVQKIIEKTDAVRNELRKVLQRSGYAESEEEIDGEGMRTKIADLKKTNELLMTKMATLKMEKAEALKIISELPNEQQEFFYLDRNLKLNFEMFSELKKKMQQIDIQHISTKSSVSISVVSQMPGPVMRTSLLLRLIFSLLIGLFIGCAYALILEVFDGSVKHHSDLEEFELNVLGNIISANALVDRKGLSPNSYRPELLICKERPESPIAMSFKYVRTHLRTIKNSEGQLAQIISITSPEHGDGKSFVSANLATCVAQLDKKVLLIDSDLRNPSQARFFGYQNREGLTSLLTLKTSLNNAIIKSKVSNLDILPAGWSHANPTELICSEKFQLLLKHLRTRYDYIIVDSPPVIPVVDAAVLASQADATIMIASYRKTPKDAVRMAHRKILQIGYQQVFALLNRTAESNNYSYYFYPYYDHREKMGAPSNEKTLSDEEELAKFKAALDKKRAG